MAGKNRSDVELVVTARNEGSNAVDELTSSFEELEAVSKKSGNSAEELAKKQDLLADMLRRAKEAQQQFNKAGSGGDKALSEQGQIVEKFRRTLSELSTEYKTYASAQQLPRAPGQYLVDQLASQQKRFSSLGDSIKATKTLLKNAETGLDTNQGVDETAAKRISKQREAVIKLGNAWKETQKLVRQAQSELANTRTTSDNSSERAKAAKVQLESLREQVKAAAELEKSRRDEVKNADKATREQVQAQLAATRATKALRAERDKQVEVERTLRGEARKFATEVKNQEKAVDKLVEKASKQKVAYTDLKTALVDFEKVQTGEGLKRQEENIEKLRATLNRLEKQYSDTGKKIENTQVKLGKASGPDPKAVKRFGDLEVKIKNTEQAIAREVKNLNSLKQRLNETGASSDGLAKSQERLANLSSRITQSQQKVKEQYDQTKEAADRAGKAGEQAYKRLSGNGSRQSLSYLQRIRGELLSIAATYTGLYAVGDGVRSIYDASVLTQKATSRLSARFYGDMNAVGTEIQFVRSEADRLGLEFETLLDEYTKFVSSVPEGTLSLEQLRFTFSGIAETARVVGLSNEDVKATFKALSQIASKGALQMEELKGQLGERIPKAVESAAKGISKLTGELITTEELLKRINNSEVTSDSIVAIAAALKDEFGDDLSKALESPQASVADFKNSVFELRESLSESGFFNTLVSGLKELTGEMKKPEFREGIKDFADALTGLGRFVINLIKNFSELKTVLVALIGAKVIASVGAFVKQILQLSIAISGSISGLKSYDGALGSLKVTMKGVALGASQLTSAFAAGFGIGTLLNETFPQVRKFGLVIVGEFEKLTLRSQAVWEKFKAYLKGFFSTGLSSEIERANIDAALEKQVQQVDDTITEMFAEIDGKLGEGVKAPDILKREDAAKQVKSFTDEINKGLNIFRGESNFDDLKETFDDITEEFEEESASTLEAKLKLIEKEYTDFLKKLNTFQVGSESQIANIRNSSDEKIQAIEDKRTKGLINETRAAKAIAAIRERSEKEIANLRAQQAQLSNARSQTNSLIKTRKEAETEKFYSDELKKTQAEINKLVSKRKTELARINELEKLGLIDAEEKATRNNKLNEESLRQIREAVRLAQELANQSGNLQLQQFAKSFDGFEELERRKALVSQLRDAESEINDLTTIRQARIQEINAIRDTGAISSFEAESQVRDVQNDINEKLRIAVERARQFASILGDEAMLANLDATDAGLGRVTDQLIKADDINQQFASGLTDAFFDWASGAATAGEALRQFFSDFLRQIAKAIIQALILRAVTGAFGGGNLGAATAGAVNPSVHHDGGIVGKDGKSNRTVPAWIFANAFRYHTGGVAGLKPDEVPAILQKGEQVIPRDQVGKQQAAPQNIKIVNTIDSSSVVEQGINSHSGQKAILNFFRANKSQVKQVLA